MKQYDNITHLCCCPWSFGCCHTLIQFKIKMEQIGLMFVFMNALYFIVWIYAFIHKCSSDIIWLTTTFIHKFSLTSWNMMAFKAQETSYPRKMRFSSTVENGRKPSLVWKKNFSFFLSVQVFILVKPVLYIFTS